MKLGVSNTQLLIDTLALCLCFTFDRFIVLPFDEAVFRGKDIRFAAQIDRSSVRVDVSRGWVLSIT